MPKPSNSNNDSGDETNKRPKGHIKYAACFLLGIAVTKGMDTMLETQSFNMSRVLDSTGTVGTMSMIKGAVGTSRVMGISSTGSDNRVEVSSKQPGKQDTISPDSSSILSTEKDSHSLSDPSAFAKIVETASMRALSVKPKGRKAFNVTWWHHNSGLTTAGGLNPDDRALLGLIYRNATSVFEYGLGESTYIANYVGVPRYAGIDSDPVWIAQAREKVAPHFRFYLGDIGPTGAWGFPKAAKLDKAVLDYQLAPLVVEPQPFDVYMVDGRWRVPCLIASFLHASARGATVTTENDANTQPKTTVLLHDCEPPSTIERGRKEYKLADHLLDLVAHSGNKLCVYQRKSTTTDQQLQELWHQHMDQILR